MVRKNYCYSHNSRYGTILAENCEVIKIDYQNQKQQSGFFKTCFYCPSYLKPHGRMFIAWGQTNFKVGDILSCRGRLKGDVFICSTLQIKKSASKKESDYDEVSLANLKQNINNHS